jgi:hypothetical protein
MFDFFNFSFKRKKRLYDIPHPVEFGEALCANDLPQVVVTSYLSKAEANQLTQVLDNYQLIPRGGKKRGDTIFEKA